MKSLVVYYSLGGATKKAAEYTARETGSDIEGITDLERRNGFLGFLKSGREAMTGKSSQIGRVNSRIEDYDLLIIATPIWAGKTSSPINAFLSGFGDKIKNYVVILTHGSPKDDYADVTEIFSAKLKKAPLAFLSMSAQSLKIGDFSAASEFIKTIKGLDAGK